MQQVFHKENKRPKGVAFNSMLYGYADEVSKNQTRDYDCVLRAPITQTNLFLPLGETKDYKPHSSSRATKSVSLLYLLFSKDYFISLR